MKLHRGMCGLLSIEWGPWCLHLLVPSRTFWVWGRRDRWYDGPFYEWGLGPLFLLICFWPDAWCKEHKLYRQECACREN